MKRILLVSLVLALLMALVIPTMALAAKPASYNASGSFISIDEGKVKLLAYDPVNPANTQWQVKNRHIQGEFLPSGEDGCLEGPFTITYDALVNGYQAGNFTGNLKAKSVNLKIKGTSYGIVAQTEIGLKVILVGSWSKDSKIKGTFEAVFFFVPTPDGQHIDYLTYSSFNLVQLP